MSEQGKKYNVAVAGATGAVGGAMLDVLARLDFPVNELRLLASERSVCKKLKFVITSYSIHYTKLYDVLRYDKAGILNI